MRRLPKMCVFEKLFPSRPGKSSLLYRFNLRQDARLKSDFSIYMLCQRRVHTLSDGIDVVMRGIHAASGGVLWRLPVVSYENDTLSITV